MLITILTRSMWTYKVKRPVHWEWHLPTLATPVMVDHAAIQGEITFGWDNIPNPTPASGTYYVHDVWTFKQLFVTWFYYVYHLAELFWV
jgi:hypothetical protein